MYTKEEYITHSNQIIKECLDKTRDENDLVHISFIEKLSDEEKYTELKNFVVGNLIPELNLDIFESEKTNAMYNKCYEQLMEHYTNSIIEINKVIVGYASQLRKTKTLKEFTDFLDKSHIHMDGYSKKMLAMDSDQTVPILQAGFHNLAWINLLTSYMSFINKGRHVKVDSSHLWMSFYKCFPKKKNILALQH